MRPPTTALEPAAALADPQFTAKPGERFLRSNWGFTADGSFFSLPAEAIMVA